MTRVLLTGRDGQLGAELRRCLPEVGEVVATDRRMLDLEDSAAIRRVVQDVRPAIIVNAAAYTAVDRAEQEAEIAAHVNGAAPGILAEEARRAGALLVHFSTDYVFDGVKPAAYTEDDEPNPLNVYGLTKAQGEKTVVATHCRYLIIRTSWVYAPHGRNFFTAIAQKASAGGPLRVVADQHGVPTAAAFLAAATAELLKRPAPPQGTLNIVPSGSATWFEFAQAIVRQLAIDVAVESISASQYAAAAARPRNSVLDNARLASLLGRTPESWQDGLARCAAEYLRTGSERSHAG